jgi:hypothetical protein
MFAKVKVDGLPTRTHVELGPKKRAYEISSLESPSHVNFALEKAVWRKTDLCILPTVAMFFLLSFLVSKMTGC